MPTKLNITPGPWAKNGDETFVFANIKNATRVSDKLICDPPYMDADYPRWGANATAIVTAVNNTYHKGINPEAVPEMLEALSDLYKWVSALTDWEGGTELDPPLEKTKQIIQKATL